MQGLYILFIPLSTTGGYLFIICVLCADSTISHFLIHGLFTIFLPYFPVYGGFYGKITMGDPAAPAVAPEMPIRLCINYA